MKKLVYNIQINASPEKVWNALWDLENYKKWTHVFCPGTYYKTNILVKGSSVHFLNESGSGMYSEVDEMIPNQLMSFRHIGEIEDFKEKPIKDQPWSNAIEKYELLSNTEGTLLRVSADTVEEYIDYMNTNFPKALEELKKIAES